MNRNRILVTGGAGFIGSHTVDLLLTQGKAVVVLDNLVSGHIENLQMQHPDLEFIEGDVLEYPLVADLMRGCDAVMHLAAIASVPRSLAEPLYTAQVNTIGTLNVLEAIRRSKRDIRLVYASSSAVYGDARQLPCVETAASAAECSSPYALQKMQSEEYAALYAKLFGISSLGMRYFNVYGPRQDPSSPYSGVISLFMDAYRQDQEFTVYGDGKQTRDFIYVSDIAFANALALQSDYHGVMNIGTGIQQTLLDLIGHIEEAGKHPAKVKYTDARHGDIRDSYGDVSQAKTHLGFKSTIPLSAGMKTMLSAAR